MHADTGGALLDVASLVHHQHPIWAAQMVDDIAAQVIADRIGIPPGAANRCCIPSGDASPACSAMVQQFLRRSPDGNRGTNARARRRGSTRANRPAIRPISSSNCSRRRTWSALSPAATAGLS